MKKGIFTIVICMIVIVSQAQEHLRFMDIPLDGTFENFCNKLISEKGLSASKMTEDEEYFDMEARKLVGTFYGIKNCDIYVRKHDRLNDVSSVVVWNTQCTLSKDEARRVIVLFDVLYLNQANIFSIIHYCQTSRPTIIKHSCFSNSLGTCDSYTVRLTTFINFRIVRI